MHKCYSISETYACIACVQVFHVDSIDNHTVRLYHFLTYPCGEPRLPCILHVNAFVGFAHQATKYII